MAQKTDSLWKSPNGRYEIFRWSKRSVHLVDNCRGVCDWPIDYGRKTRFTARVGYDHPEWWPVYVKEAVERLFRLGRA